MFNSLPLPLVLLIFAVGAFFVWFSGIRLSNTTDVLSDRFKIGQSLGGLLILAVATNLPEIAITATAAITNNLGIAIGNILGGISIQTVVLALLDALGLRNEEPLTSTPDNLKPVLEGALVVAVLILSIMAAQFPSSLVFFRLTPGVIAIALTWVVGIWLINKARKGLPWKPAGKNSGSANNGQESKTSGQDQTGQQGHSSGSAGNKKGNNSGNKSDRLEKETKKAREKQEQQKKKSTAVTLLILGAAAIFTLIGGVLLEESGNSIANQVGLSGVLFGATILAASTSLPEVSTGLQAMKLRDYTLAISDIFGGNSFLPVLFLLASLLSGKSVLPNAQHSDLYLAGLGILLTAVYIFGLIFRSRRLILWMGIDSLAVLILYIIGIVGLIGIGNS